MKRSEVKRSEAKPQAKRSEAASEAKLQAKRQAKRPAERRDAERQALATARLATEFKDFTPKIPCPEYASDYQALLAISRASDPRMWRKGMNDGWVDLEKQSNKVYIKEGTVAACRGVTCAPLRIADKLFRVIRELYLPGLELGDAAVVRLLQVHAQRALVLTELRARGRRFRLARRARARGGRRSHASVRTRSKSAGIPRDRGVGGA